MDQDQFAPHRKVWSGLTLFAIRTSKIQQMTKQMTLMVNDSESVKGLIESFQHIFIGLHEI